MNKTNKSEYNYENKLASTSKAKTTKLNFKNKIKQNDKKNIIQDRNAILKKCLPSFVEYLENKINSRNRQTMDALLNHDKKNKFCKLLKLFSNQQILPPKEEFVNVISREAKYSATRPVYQIKLFKLLRKKYIQTITTTLEEPSKLYKLYYLINVTKMHKNIASQRFFRELIRKWRFVSFAKKMARRKLELMYKNLHASYMQMADEMFGEDDDVNPSIIKEFEKFGSNVGMFTGQEPEVDEEINKRYYQTVDKKYVFTTRASGRYEEKKKPVVTKNTYMKIEQEEIVDRENFQPNATIDLRKSNKVNTSFAGIKKKGFASKYFKSNEGDAGKK